MENKKQKTEVYFPWSANDKRLSTFAMSANGPIYAFNTIPTDWTICDPHNVLPGTLFNDFWRNLAIKSSTHIWLHQWGLGLKTQSTGFQCVPAHMEDFKNHILTTNPTISPIGSVPWMKTDKLNLGPLCPPPSPSERLVACVRTE
jgi:hypothetical protein